MSFLVIYLTSKGLSSKFSLLLTKMKIFLITNQNMKVRNANIGQQLFHSKFSLDR